MFGKTNVRASLSPHSCGQQEEWVDQADQEDLLVVLIVATSRTLEAVSDHDSSPISGIRKTTLLAVI